MYKKILLMSDDVENFDTRGNRILPPVTTKIMGKEIQLSTVEHYSVAEQQNVKNVIQLEVYKKEYKDQPRFQLGNKIYKVIRTKNANIDSNTTLLVGAEVADTISNG